MSRPKIGEAFENRYLIISELGAGGMGWVYHAKQIDADREVALKFLRDENIDDEESVERFFREFKILSRLAHANIMTMYGLALDADRVPFAITEFIDGENLRKVLSEEGKMSWQRAVHIAIQICDAMQYAHEQGVIHRDLKPDNVMLMKVPAADFVKLVDFGLSRVLVNVEDVQKLTVTGQLVGSVNYMAPELMRAKADERSDIYSLGCTLFELLSGEQLFDADAAIGIIFKHANEDPQQRFASLSSEVPRRLVAIMTKMLAKNPEHRYASMKQVSAELQTLRADLDDIAVSAKGGKSIKPQAMIITCAALLSIVAIVFVFRNFINTASPPAKITTVQKALSASMIPRKGESVKNLMDSFGDPIKAEALAEQWLRKYLNRPGVEPRDKMYVLLPLCQLKASLNKPNEIFHIQEKIDEILPLMRNDDPITFDAYSASALFWLAQQDRAKAAKIASKALDLLRGSSILRAKPQFAERCIWVLMNTGDYKTAISAAEDLKNLTMGEALQNAGTVQCAEMDIGDLHVLAGELKPAYRSYEDAYRRTASIMKAVDAGELSLSGGKAIRAEMARMGSPSGRNEEGEQMTCLGRRMHYLSKSKGNEIFNTGLNIMLKDQEFALSNTGSKSRNYALHKLERKKNYATWLTVGEAAEELDLPLAAITCARMAVQSIDFEKFMPGQSPHPGRFLALRALTIRLMRQPDKTEEALEAFKRSIVELKMFAEYKEARRQEIALNAELAEAAVAGKHRELAEKLLAQTLLMRKNFLPQYNGSSLNYPVARACEALGQKVEADKLWKEEIRDLPPLESTDVNHLSLISDCANLVAGLLRYGRTEDANKIIDAPQMMTEKCRMLRCYCLQEKAKYLLDQRRFSEALPALNDAYKLCMSSPVRPIGERYKINIELLLKLEAAMAIAHGAPLP